MDFRFPLPPEGVREPRVIADIIPNFTDAEFTVVEGILAVTLSDVSLAFDNALANSQMVGGLPAKQQKKALIFGMLLSCLTMVVLTFLVFELRAAIDWIRYPAGAWLVFVVYKMWFDPEVRHSPEKVGGALMKAILLITITDLTMASDNAIANSEFALRVGKEHVWTVLFFGLAISCAFMILCTYLLVWIRRYINWVRYPAGLWLLYVAFLILTGKEAAHHAAMLASP
jgi:predicted tellurium resistance membrane protein TerC